jgi:hypothetical protein
MISKIREMQKRIIFNKRRRQGDGGRRGIAVRIQKRVMLVKE